MITSVSTDVMSLKLHVDSGVVWALNGQNIPTCTRQTVADFFGADMLKNCERVRVVGSAQNASLITALYDLKLRKEIESLQVVTPLVCQTHTERQDPEFVLWSMRNFTRSPSLGGFHEVTHLDYPSYVLLHELKTNKNENEFKLSELSRRYLKAHPAWQAISFLRFMDEFKCAHLLANIIDPRWYIDSCHPDRTAKLEAWLGLNPKTQAGVIDSKQLQWRYHERCSLVFDCWFDNKLSLEARSNFNEFGLLPWEEDKENCPVGLAPCDFIWRVWGAVETKPIKAALVGSTYFVKFLRNAWLSALYADSKSAGHFPLFRPVDFFKYAVEAAAYTAHMSGD